MRRAPAKRASKKAAPLLAGLLALSSLCGCGTLDFSGARRGDRVNPSGPLWLNRPIGAMKIYLRRELAIAGKERGERFQHGKAAIDVKHRRVFLGTADHGLYALKATDGETIWRFETLGAVQSEVVYDAELDAVYFGSNDGALYAVSAFDGALKFRFDTGAEVRRAPVLSGETLYVMNAGDTLIALDRRSGKERWRARRSSAAGMEIAGYAGPAVEAGRVYAAFSDGHVTAYDAITGEELWSPVDLAQDAESSEDSVKYMDIDTTPVLVDHPQGRVVVVGAYDTGLYALDAKTGARVWWNEQLTGVTELMLFHEPAHATGVAGEPELPARSVLIASSANIGLSAVEPETGRTLWRNPVPEGGVTAAVQVAGALAIGTTRYGVFLLSPLSGKVIDGVDLGSGVAVTPAVAGNRLLTMTNEGTLLGMTIEVPGARGMRKARYEASLGNTVQPSSQRAQQ